ncbi:MAG: hypothetical protein IKI63_07145, partial [Clostridia bacterium]|nr:hypothetical protein [Clostridia bacterium]
RSDERSRLLTPHPALRATFPSKGKAFVSRTPVSISQQKNRPQLSDLRANNGAGRLKTVRVAKSTRSS